MVENSETFRDRPTNLDEMGSRKWVYAKQPKGRLYLYRSAVAWLLLAFLIAVPFIRVNGHPFVLIDIANRKFILFGAIFWAQDTFILALLMLSFLVFIILFTVTYGRVWCGWACPQTIFLEMVFRRVEFLIEGDYQTRKGRDEGPFTADKAFRKTLKHLIFALIALAMTNTFLMWFIGSDRWFQMVNSPGDHLSSFSIIALISLVFYWIYAFFREQICTMVCPYGRMQGVLLDNDSVVVSYDYRRGEPRGAKATGDCIDCRRCMAVCPTGIDIRQGSQFECIHCAACIDECNIVMKKTGKPQGLIRYDSYNGIERGHRRLWTARNKAYSAVLILLVGFIAVTLLNRPAIETTILRTPGMLYQEQPNDAVSNLYNIKIVNKTFEDLQPTLRLISHDGRLELAGSNISLESRGLYESVFLLHIPKTELQSGKNDVVFGLFINENLTEKIKVTFIAP